MLAMAAIATRTEIDDGWFWCAQRIQEMLMRIRLGRLAEGLPLLESPVCLLGRRHLVWSRPSDGRDNFFWCYPKTPNTPSHRQEEAGTWSEPVFSVRRKGPKRVHGREGAMDARQGWHRCAVAPRESAISLAAEPGPIALLHEVF